MNELGVLGYDPSSKIPFMKIGAVLKKFQKQESVIVRDKTFEPHQIDTFKLETGDLVYWIKDGEDLWMSIDLESDEIIIFHEIEAEVDATEESVFYAGDDYEFSYEASAKVLDEDDETQEVDRVEIRDFERSDGEIFRVMEFEVTGDVMTLTGRKVPEEELIEV